MSGIPMNPTCPRCGGKHGVEVSGDGDEWDCAACGGHLVCAIGTEGEMYSWHREDGSCGCETEPHTCEMDEAERAELLADAAREAAGEWPLNPTAGPNGCTCGHNGDCNCPFVETP